MEPDSGDRELELGVAAMSTFAIDAAIVHLSAAVRAFTAAGRTCDAGMACIRLGDLFSNGLGNPTAARAWFARADRLVADEPDCVEQGWIALAAMGCDVDDPANLEARAELALNRARRFGNVDLEAKALADGGLARVQAGRLVEGMAMLDEAMALICSSVEDQGTSGRSVCSFFTACYYAADFDRFANWTPLLRDRGLLSTAAGPPVFLSNHCDSVQSALLVELGRWSDAERLLVRACDDFERAMSMPSWHPAIALADLRVRQGRLVDAETLLLGKEASIQALLPAARLHLVRGDLELARAMAERGLRAVAGDRVRAVELLAVLAEVHLAAGDRGRAESASADLETRVSGLGVASLGVRAALVRAKVLAASGDVAEAVDVLETSLAGLGAEELPWPRALLHVELARNRLGAGHRAGAGMDAIAAASLFSRLDVVVSPSDAELLTELTGAPMAGLASDARQASGSVHEPARLIRLRKGWEVSFEGVTARLPDSKGLRYLAVLLRVAGGERHALDLVDTIEGLPEHPGVDRRRLGDAGPALDGEARRAYRRQIEDLRNKIDEALSVGAIDQAESLQGEIDKLVVHLAAAFGLGGRGRPSASAAERARVNVTRAIRTAIERVGEVLPEAGATLDRSVTTGLYCCFSPADGDIRWIVQS